MSKFVVTDGNFTQVITDADDYLDDLKKTDQILDFQEGIEHIERLLAVIDLLLGVNT